jgi:hypothetical protein
MSSPQMTRMSGFVSVVSIDPDIKTNKIMNMKMMGKIFQLTCIIIILYPRIRFQLKSST